MKEAFWGFLIICLGLIGIVIIQLFQNVTITNDQTYYLLKEVTEASMYDSIDLTYYRTKGKIRIVEDKFVENFTRRFAESADLNRNYNIRIHDIVEEPPKVSLSIGTYVFSIQGEQFNIAQNIDAILEAKYDESDITGKDPIIEDPIIEDPIIEDPIIEDPEVEDLCPTCEVGDPNCSNGSTCISGDLRFVGWEDVTVPAYLCKGDAVAPITRKASYQSCECGNWVDKSNQITSTGSSTVTHYTYNWTLVVESAIKKLNESDNKTSKYGICTTDIDITETGVSCPAGGFDLRIGSSLTLRPSYIPPNSINRNLLWTTNNDNIILQYSRLNIGLTEFNDASITGNKSGTSTVTVKTSNNKTDTCKINIFKALPICTSSGGSDTWTVDNITLTGTCTSNNGSGCSPLTVTKNYSSNINSTTETPGTICNSDGASNPKNCVTCPVQTVKIDKTNPTISVSNPSGGNCTTGDVVITYTAGDTLSGLKKVQYKSSSSGWTDAKNQPTYGSNSYSSVITFTAIRHEDISFRSIDVVGNVSGTVTTHIEKANVCVLPTLIVNCPKDPIKTNEKTICSLDSSTSVAGVKLVCTNNSTYVREYTTTNSDKTIHCTPTVAGTMTITASKTDWNNGSTSIGVNDESSVIPPPAIVQCPGDYSDEIQGLFGDICYDMRSPIPWIGTGYPWKFDSDRCAGIPYDYKALMTKKISKLTDQEKKDLLVYENCAMYGNAIYFLGDHEYGIMDSIVAFITKLNYYGNPWKFNNPKICPEGTVPINRFTEEIGTGMGPCYEAYYKDIFETNGDHKIFEFPAFQLPGSMISRKYMN